jgi:hypothetical protein
MEANLLHSRSHTFRYIDLRYEGTSIERCDQDKTYSSVRAQNTPSFIAAASPRYRYLDGALAAAKADTSEPQKLKPLSNGRGNVQTSG